MFSRIVRTFAIFGLAAFLISAGLAGRACADGPIRVLILSGGADQGWRTTTPLLRQILADTGRFDVRVCESTAGLSPNTLSEFDLLVDNEGGASRGDDTEKAIGGFVESGKGLVITHGALAAGAAGRRLGYWPLSSSGAPQSPVQFFDVTIGRAEHPVVSGMKGRFKTADALCPGLSIIPGAEVIATAAGGKNEVPVLIASSHGKGRVLCVALGHDPSAIHERPFSAMFARGSEWAATGKVTLPTESVQPGPNPDAVKGLVITGGHDHEAAFYSLFDGYKDLDWLPVDTSANAFKKDLRGKYDVIIMYDFTRDLDDACKQNLRDFAESGKGIVVLHHALLNYQKWPWWSEEVVGGRYRLERSGNIPSSSVKDNQEVFVTPQGEHPVTAGIGPFHITDETYKGMYISDRVRPLLTTDNPTSDPYLAWIGPYSRSRVVAIQLGHGHSAFGHPAYRTLVHGAVLWAAGMSK